MMQQNKIHHIGIIVPDEEQVHFLFQLMGLTSGHTVYVEEYEATCIFGKMGGRQDGQECMCEFIVPKPGSKLSQFNRGLGGIHHLAIETSDIRATTEYLGSELEIDFLEESPVLAGNLLINFIPSSMTRGIVIEYVQKVPQETAIDS